MRIRKRRPNAGSIWPMISVDRARKDGPTGEGWVQLWPGDDELIQLVLPRDADADTGVVIKLNRRRARMIAKRINECLDATRYG